MINQNHFKSYVIYYTKHLGKFKFTVCLFVDINLPMNELFQEINTLKPHDDFRLWLTAEVHPKFPTILLQSSLKITYEVI